MHPGSHFLSNTAIVAQFLEFTCGRFIINTAEFLPLPAKGQFCVLIFTIRMFLKKIPII